MNAINEIYDYFLNNKIKIVKSLANALDYVHDNKFIHRDLKPENIMIDNKYNFYLIDFGIAKVMTNTDDTVTRAKGTIHYLAPETLEVAEGGSVTFGSRVGDDASSLRDNM